MSYISKNMLLLLLAKPNSCLQSNFPESECCTSLVVRTSGSSNSSQYIRFGGYTRIDTYFDRPVYVHEARDEFLFYMAGRSRGLWMIGPEVGQFSGGLANRADNQVGSLDSLLFITAVRRC